MIPALIGSALKKVPRHPFRLSAVSAILLLSLSPGWAFDMDLVPPPGNYSGLVTISLSVPSGVKVHYSLDGSEPSMESPVFGDSLDIDRDTVIRYFAVDPTGVKSRVMEAFYRIEGTQEAEVELRTGAVPPGGTYEGRIKVGLRSRVGATVYYTIDGTEPDTSSPIFTTPLILAVDTLLRFFAVDVTGERESLREERYTFKLVSKLVDTTPPVIKVVPSPENYMTGDQIRMEFNEDCYIYFTIDGSEPTENSSRLTEPLLLKENTTLKFFAVDLQGNRCETQVAQYLVDNTPPTASVLPDPGVHGPPLLVRLEVSDGDSTVYFTLDGSEPDEDSRVYREPIVLLEDTLIRYFPMDRAGNRGEIREARYVLDGTPPRTVVSPLGGAYRPPIIVTLETEKGARIHYSLDGYKPGPDSPIYTSPFTFDDPVTLKFYAVDGVGNREPVQSRSYSLRNGVWRKYARGVFLIPSVTDGRTFWMGSDEGLVVYHVGSGSRKFVGEREGLIGKRINDLVLDEEGNLWVATEEGLDRQEKGGGFVHIDRRKGLPAKEVLSIGVDVDNSIWAGTADGVAHIRDDAVVRVLTERDGLVDDKVLSIAVDAEGNKWFGTRKGLSRLKGTEWLNFTKNSGLVDNEVRTVALDNEWNVWCGTSRGISVLHGKEWSSYRRSDGLPSDLIVLIAPDPDGEIWVATKGGVVRFDGERWIQEESP